MDRAVGGEGAARHPASKVVIFGVILTGPHILCCQIGKFSHSRCGHGIFSHHKQFTVFGSHNPLHYL
ncbi:hypothetical protein VN97_g4673 [Penicillium thymicola]|uniref:Uncharacterized protein n=1 Tax=Penicillium thymicola TaxID=293382 RepID=A0AAI9X954_PENTH|nr:hypothetical protein VN97_g4673 [Penicillium thymicola]